jgi:hypothetical protein
VKNISFEPRKNKVCVSEKYNKKKKIMSDAERQANKNSAIDNLRNMKFMKRKEEAKRIEILRSNAATSVLSTVIASSSSSSKNQQDEQQSNNNNNNNQQLKNKNKPKVLSLADLQKMRVLGNIDHTKARRNFSLEDVANSNNSSAFQQQQAEKEEQEEVVRLDPNALMRSNNNDKEEQEVQNEDYEDNFGNERAEFDKKREANAKNQTWRSNNNKQESGKRRQRNEQQTGQNDDDDEYDPLQVFGDESKDDDVVDDSGAFGMI